MYRRFCFVFCTQTSVLFLCVNSKRFKNQQKIINTIRIDKLTVFKGESKKKKTDLKKFKGV